MRWWLLVMLALAGAVVQATFAQVLWLPTSVGWIGPDVLVGLAVFVGLSVRSGTDAAIAGWVIGMALELTLSGPGTGALGLLFALATAATSRLRGGMFHERILSRAMLGLIFALMVYLPYAMFDSLVGQAWQGFGRRMAQTAGVCVYTAAITPVVVAILRPMQRLVAPTAGGR
jgi:hypothetical protein